MSTCRVLHRQVLPKKAGGESGFALILAILALLLLTFLGLTLATTTSTELQIANNYRYSQQALYNAEAGVEAAKVLLKAMTWSQILPLTRGDGNPGGDNPWTGEEAQPRAAPAPGQDGEPRYPGATRNYENAACDQRGNGMGYGIVLSDGGAESPFEYKTTLFGETLNGAFTVWIRRPFEAGDFGGCVGCWRDWALNSDTLVLTSEGVAPYTGSTGTTTFGQTHRAVSLLEVTLTSAPTQQQAGCEFYGGQAGGPGGTNFNPCGVGSGDAIISGLPGAAGGADVNPNAQ